MLALVVVLVAIVDVGPGFQGGGVVDAARVGEAIVVGLEVKVAVGDGPVVAHLRTPAQQWVTHPMIDDGAGRWVGIVEVRPADWMVVFEAIGSGTLSEPRRFTELGLDRSLLVGPSEVPPEATPPDPPWGWLALACAAAGIAIIAGLSAWGGPSDPRHLRRRPPRRPSAPPRRFEPS